MFSCSQRRRRAQETMSGGRKHAPRLPLHSPSMQAAPADEPTSHLDQDGIRLRGQLAIFDGALLIVSHDRHFSTR